MPNSVDICAILKKYNTASYIICDSGRTWHFCCGRVQEKGFVEFVSKHFPPGISMDRSFDEHGCLHIVMKEEVVDEDFDIVSRAVEDDLDGVIWLHNNRVCSDICSHVMSVAATRGYFGIVKWMSENCDEGYNTDAIDLAAGYGTNIDIIRYLHNDGAQCTYRAMDTAATCGEVEILEFLQEHRSEGCSVNAMRGASANGKLDSVKWLLKNRRETSAAEGLRYALKFGQQEVVDYLSTYDDSERERECKEMLLECGDNLFE